VVILVQGWDLQLEGCHSLKDKRAILQGLKAAVRKHNVALAEVEHQDAWQLAGLAAVTVSSDRRSAEETLRSVDAVIDAADGVRILNTKVTVV
jgi:uncharacterized protein YlxP (DUF503 family)